MQGWLSTDPHAHPELYRAILERILTGELAAGQRLVEEDLARMYEVSRTPIREVLLALQKDGLVVRERNKGARVASFTADDVEELFDIRKALEVSCIPAAVRTIRLGELLDLQRRLQSLGSLRGAQLRTEQSQLDLELHSLIISHSRNRRLIVYMGTLSMLINSLQLASYRLETRADEAAAEHLDLVGALLDRDVERAQHLLLEHIEHGKRNAVELLIKVGSRVNGRASSTAVRR